MRVDAEVLRMTGRDAEAFRRQSDRMLQTTTPQRAAERILAGVKRNARRVIIGPDARVLDVLQRVLGAGYQGLLVRRSRQLRAGG
jgi:hypothetical protein